VPVRNKYTGLKGGVFLEKKAQRGMGEWADPKGNKKGDQQKKGDRENDQRGKKSRGVGESHNATLHR